MYIISRDAGIVFFPKRWESRPIEIRLDQKNYEALQYGPQEKRFRRLSVLRTSSARGWATPERPHRVATKLYHGNKLTLPIRPHRLAFRRICRGTACITAPPGLLLFLAPALALSFILREGSEFRLAKCRFCCTLRDYCKTDPTLSVFSNEFAKSLLYDSQLTFMLFLP